MQSVTKDLCVVKNNGVAIADGCQKGKTYLPIFSQLRKL